MALPAIFGAGAIGGAILGGISSAWGADRSSDMADHAMDFTRDQTAAQMAFQERMRGSQYQTAVGDMKAAGLNPMLAYAQGGAGTPSGASGGGAMGTAQKPDVTDAMVSAAQAERISAETQKIRTETRILEDEFDDGSERDPTGGRLPKAVSNRLKQFMGTEAWYRAQHEIRKAELTSEQRLQVIQYIKNLATNNELDKLDLPKAINEAKAQDTAFKRYVSPFLDDAGKVTNSAAGIAGQARGIRRDRFIIHGN